jgi:hypothetical protein
MIMNRETVKRLAIQCGDYSIEHGINGVQFTNEELQAFALAIIENYKAEQWISVADRLPESQQIVLVVNGRQKRCVMYVSKHSINVEDRGFEEGAEYFEDEDASYWPEGWYEENSHDEMSWDIDFTPTHWQPFPALHTPQNDKETV